MNLLESEFVPYHIATKLKDMGFNEPCLRYFMMGILNPSNLTIDYSYFDEMSAINPNMNNFKYAPTFLQAIDFIESKLDIYVEFLLDKTTYPKYTYEYTKFIGDPKNLANGEWGWDKTIMSKYLFKNKRESIIDYLETVTNL